MSIQPYYNRLPNGVLFEKMIIMLIPLSVSTSFVVMLLVVFIVLCALIALEYCVGSSNYGV